MPDRIVIGEVVETFLGSEFDITLDAEGIIGDVGFDATVSAMDTVFAGFCETAFLDDFTATGHGLTTRQRLDCQIQLTNETSLLKGLVLRSHSLPTSTVSGSHVRFDFGWVVCADVLYRSGWGHVLFFVTCVEGEWGVSPLL